MTELKKTIEGIVEPGDTARCKVTKIEGIVTVRHDYLYGVPRIGIQPQGSFEGKQHETIHLDLPQAELLEKKTVVRPSDMIPTRTTQLGDKVKDTISGFEGICTGVAEWLYACSKVMIQPEKIDPKKYAPVDPVWFDEPQVKVVKTKVKEVKKEHKSTGGFSDRISSFKFSSSNKSISR